MIWKTFEEQFVDFKSFKNDKLLMNEVTNELLRQLAYDILQELRISLDENDDLFEISFGICLRALCNIISEYTNTEKTTNWETSYLQADFKENIYYFKNKPFNKFMDAMSKMALEYFQGTSIDKMNETFEENNFGYRLQMNLLKPWVCINSDVEVVSTIEELSEETIEDIRQARVQLTRISNDRARKDVIRKCLSAMENLLKKFTNTSNINDADMKLRSDEKKWGPKVITGEGIKLWKVFHEDYTDIRNENDQISNITLEQSIYFIDRIWAYVNYICKIEQLNDYTI